MSEDFYCDEVLSGQITVKKVFESDIVLAYHHTRPSYPVHIVVIPKKHISSLATIEEKEMGIFMELMNVVKIIATLITWSMQSYNKFGKISGLQAFTLACLGSD